MNSVNSKISNQAPVAGSLENLRNTPSKSNGVPDSAFRDQLKALKDTRPSTSTTGTTASAAAELSAATPAAIQSSPLKFSNHAVDRMQARGIRFSPEQMAKIESAVNKAASKGAKDTLLLTDDSALIVSVKDRTVVTVMDKASLKENVFTKIDSTVMI